jgi:hypothetical protein
MHDAPARLVLGPLLRYVGPEAAGTDTACATIWVETDRPCAVSVRTDVPDASGSARTFAVGEHHYALVLIRGLPIGQATPYTVLLDDERVWPTDNTYPPSVIRPWQAGATFRLSFGSCRVTGPLDDEALGTDALAAMSERMQQQDPSEWPDLLLLVGDQVYADENISPLTLEFVRQRRRDGRDQDGPPERPEVNDFEEYTHLYQEAWTPAPVRWLLSTVPVAMIFDDHDVRDDWNTSVTWRRQMEALPWWHVRIVSGLMSYWLYQHLGNLDPEALDESEVYAQLRAASDGAEGERILSALAAKADKEADGGPGVRWSYRRDLGAARLLVIDSRCGRIVTDDRRQMVDDEEWQWIVDNTSGNHDHLLIATSVPFLLPPGVHHLEAWNEAVSDGAWGRRFRRIGEKIRQGADLEHWAAFGTSFAAMADLVADIGSGLRGKPPATVIFLSGDVHFSYGATARVKDRPDVQSVVVQAVCSPLRNPLARDMRAAQRITSRRAAYWLGRLLARSAKVPPPSLDWSVDYGPSFTNDVGTIELTGRKAALRMDAASPGPVLAEAFRADLTGEG